jgi:hypothetical protein
MHTRLSAAATMTRTFVWVLLAIPLAAQTVDRLAGKEERVDRADQLQRPGSFQVIAAPEAANGTSYAVAKGVLFRDGVIEVDVAGQPATNGRADDQVRRNHSTQYSSHPDFDFARSRQEAPEKCESYVDLQPGVETKYKIEVEGRKARLYVNGAEQPGLIVDDMKLEPKEGGVALWVGPGAEGYFSNLKIAAK